VPAPLLLVLRELEVVLDLGTVGAGEGTADGLAISIISDIFITVGRKRSC